MEGCAFIREGMGKCSSKLNLKEVEFKHPTYKDLGEVIYLCQSHFMEVFGQSVAIKDSTKPLEEERWLELMVRNEEARYRRKLADTRNQVKNGIGMEYFDWGTWYAHNTRVLEDLKSKLKLLRRYVCRFEWCKEKIKDFKNVYTIRVYPKTQLDYINLNFCCLNHWEVFKKRIGLRTMTGDLDETKKKTIGNT